MIDWIWRRLSARVNTLITERIVTFHEAMVERKQIPPPPCSFGESPGLADVAPAGYMRIRVAGE
jgi:hypothetical protein